MVYEGLSPERSDVIARRIALTGDLPAVLSFGVPAAAGPFGDAGAALAGADYATTLRLYRAMADQGNGNAQFGLGTMYEKGRGVAQDDVEAAKWYRLAANQGPGLCSAGWRMWHKSLI